MLERLDPSRIEGILLDVGRLPPPRPGPGSRRTAPWSACPHPGGRALTTEPTSTARSATTAATTVPRRGRATTAPTRPVSGFDDERHDRAVEALTGIWSDPSHEHWSWRQDDEVSRSSASPPSAARWGSSPTPTARSSTPSPATGSASGVRASGSAWG
ncbi:MAG: hypothetical protein U5R31_11490 [Acidimicrobiia bacterium]|nr:hypothetical protein [Acidimicrobiia bacterium]